MLAPAEKYIDCEADQRAAAEPLRSPSPDKTYQPGEHDDSGKDQVDNEDEVPGISMLEERGKDHRSVGGEKIEKDVAHERCKTDFVKTPEVGTPRYLCEDPTEEDGIKGD